ncbi:MAG: hypothetical protein H6Q31_2130 [Bacteroidetes bacterium]|nr:hypothetical protein [Bacteroidota bacterium]
MAQHWRTYALNDMLLVLLLIGMVFTGVGSAEAQFVWTRSPENPVLPYWSSDPSDPNGYFQLLEPTVLYDSLRNEYTMWFTSGTGMYSSHFSISMAVSPDGEEWYPSMRNPVLRVGAPGSFDADALDAPRVVKLENEYLMYYTGTKEGVYSIGAATSSDGRTWKKLENNPVIAPGPSGSWDSRIVGYCEVAEKNGVLYMWYNGATGNHWEGIGLATSFDGRAWTKYANNPVFVPNQTGWDSHEVATPTVLLVNGVFIMVYQGMATPGPCWFGVAYSQDGIQWTRASSQSVFAPGQGWESLLGTADLVFKDGKFHMWYSGRSDATTRWQIGYASSDFVPLGVLARPSTVPHGLTLEQNYPNPFNPSTTIRYGLSEKSHVMLTVFDGLGREVAQIVDRDEEAGYHEASFDASGFASGVYLYKVQAGSSAEVRRLVLLR